VKSEQTKKSIIDFCLIYFCQIDQASCFLPTKSYSH